MMNNLRDLAEDADRGLCCFPQEVLERFDVQRESILDGSAIGTAGYEKLMGFWLDGYLGTLRDEAEAFTTVVGLHQSLVCMRSAFLNRYARIERVMRDCGGDYLAFRRVYWGAMRRRAG
jgi:phytoene synthase